jgi:hypothetical protein
VTSRDGTKAPFAYATGVALQNCGLPAPCIIRRSVHFAARILYFDGVKNFFIFHQASDDVKQIESAASS